MNRQIEYLDIIAILSFAIAIENLQENNEQSKALDEHLKKQDEQYDQIIKLLKERS